MEAVPWPGHPSWPYRGSSFRVRRLDCEQIQWPPGTNSSDLLKFLVLTVALPQIKNTVAISHALATKQRSAMKFEHLQIAVAINERFVREFYGQDNVDSLYR
jgi:hypothetical protein